MKKILLISLFIIFSFAFSILNVEKLPSSLLAPFSQYWEYRAKKDYTNSYKFEMPYLRYIYSLKWYKNFFKDYISIKSIKILKKECKDNKCIILIKVTNSNNFSYVLKDKWIKVGNTWYHRFNDRVLPL